MTDSRRRRARRSDFDRLELRHALREEKALKGGKTLAVTVPMPVSVPYRTVDYTYPEQRQMVRKTVRINMTRPPVLLKERKVHVRLPRHLPLAKASYVSIDPRRGRINIHSARQTERLLDKEYNRRRYEEHKTNRRKGRHGQLDSIRGDAYGMISHAIRKGYSARRIAETALVSRALGAS